MGGRFFASRLAISQLPTVKRLKPPQFLSVYSHQLVRAAVSGCPKNAALLVGLGRAAALQALPLRLLAPLDCGLENFEKRTLRRAVI